MEDGKANHKYNHMEADEGSSNYDCLPLHLEIRACVCDVHVPDAKWIPVGPAEAPVAAAAAGAAAEAGPAAGASVAAAVAGAEVAVAAGVNEPAAAFVVAEVAAFVAFE